MADRLVVGIGNPDRGDDAVGRLVARALRGRVPADVLVVELDGEATALLAAMQTARCVWLIDAARSGAPAGTIQRIDCCVVDVALPVGGVSSHGFGVAEAIALARALGVLPEQCVVYAVEAADFTAGAGLSQPVAATVQEVVRRLLAEFRGSAHRAAGAKITSPAARERACPRPDRGSARSAG